MRKMLCNADKHKSVVNVTERKIAIIDYRALRAKKLRVKVHHLPASNDAF